MSDADKPGKGNAAPESDGGASAAVLRKPGAGMWRLPAGRRRLGGFSNSAAGIVAGLAIWEAGVRLGNVPHYVLPPLSEVLQTAVGESGYLLAETWVTIQEIVAGFLLSVVVGVSILVMVSGASSWTPSSVPRLIIMRR